MYSNSPFFNYKAYSRYQTSSNIIIYCILTVNLDLSSMVSNPRMGTLILSGLSVSVEHVKLSSRSVWNRTLPFWGLACLPLDASWDAEVMESKSESLRSTCDILDDRLCTLQWQINYKIQTTRIISNVLIMLICK